MSLAQLGEFGLIDTLVHQLEAKGSGVVLGIGDDAAVLAPEPDRELLITCDAQVEGVHFRAGSSHTGEQLGERIAAVNLSDIAAMGGRPRWAVSSLVVPPQTQAAWLTEVYRGLSEGLARHGAEVVGGNVARGELLAFDLTLIGDVERGRALKRSSARPNEVLCVTGDLGAAAAGLAVLSASRGAGEYGAVVSRHLVPTPRVAAGRWLAASGATGACIDLSDGIAGDAWHIARQSGVTLRVETSALPISFETAAVASALGQDALKWALSGGEDFELLFTFDAKRLSLLAELSMQLNLAVTIIGRVEPGPACVIWEGEGSASMLGPPRGFEHFL